MNNYGYYTYTSATGMNRVSYFCRGDLKHREYYILNERLARIMEYV